MTLQVGTGRCRACGTKIVWVPRRSGGYHMPKESRGGPGYAIIGNELRLAQLLLVDHVCDPQLRAEQEFREVAWWEAIQSIDCPHPRCNGKQGGPCLSLIDGVTPLKSFHPERVKAVPRDRLPKPFGGKLG